MAKAGAKGKAPPKADPKKNKAGAAIVEKVEEDDLASSRFMPAADEHVNLEIKSFL